MKKSILLFILLPLTPLTNADGVYLGGLSKHFAEAAWKRDGYNLNNNQKLMAVEYKSYTVGTYVNTFHDRTHFVAKSFRLFELEDVQINIGIGLSYGYTYCRTQTTEFKDPTICPVLTPEFIYTKYKIQPVFLMIDDGVGFSLKTNF